MRVRKSSKIWGTDYYIGLRKRHGLTAAEAVNRSRNLVASLEALVSRKAIYSNNLDNPFMQEHARRLMLKLTLETQKECCE